MIKIFTSSRAALADSKVGFGSLLSTWSIIYQHKSQLISFHRFLSSRRLREHRRRDQQQSRVTLYRFMSSAGKGEDWECQYHNVNCRRLILRKSFGHVTTYTRCSVNEACEWETVVVNRSYLRVEGFCEMRSSSVSSRGKDKGC
ncbi:hypothetical protein GYMLUDRAFT_615987 [Collybiopsis luxurians FD-317 M1]|jgi:hypothetical protein|uniref:Uncharacterized protein n=1 Tax=Collybiopsis luxurians FD-317 M1 TaxID=944289 RepID=A0A0D0AI10_9AGAR|nr:hypothetical protein GYMLUDRAFT_615987 [Collybiopsis luxurians FD-317 M1]